MSRKAWLAGPFPAAVAAVVAAGLIPRLVWVSLVPTHPISDFAGYLRFAIALASDPRLSGGGWSINGGFGMALPVAILLKLSPAGADPAALARYATAVVTGLAPLIPLLLWRNVFSLRLRLAAAFAIALWPGQILFSGVFASDNWEIVPSLLLACLAVRVLVKHDAGHPVAAGLLLAWGALIRPEMAVALLPAAVAASVGGKTTRRRNLIAACVAAAGILACVGAWKKIARGPSTEAHLARSILGTLVPGAPRNGWRNCDPYLRSAYPDVFNREDGVGSEGLRIALREILRRKRFHAARMFGGSLSPVVYSDAANLYWSITAPRVLPPGQSGRELAVVKNVKLPLALLEALLLPLFFAAGIAGIVHRDKPLLCAASIVGLKSAIHIVFVSQQPRYNVPLTPIEILCVAIGFGFLFRQRRFRLLTLSLAGGATFFVAWFLAARTAHAWVLNHDEAPAYAVTLVPPGGTESFDCRLTGGDLINEKASQVHFSFSHPNAASGETVELRCKQSSGDRGRALSLNLSSLLGVAGRQERIERFVDVGGGPVLDGDLDVDPLTGWKRIILRPTGESSREFSVQLVLKNPDADIPWGFVADTIVSLSDGGAISGPPKGRRFREKNG